MKKLPLLLLLLSLLCLGVPSAFGQTYAETEPNNSFATASPLSNFDTLSGVIGGADAIDYLKPDVAFWAGYGYRTGNLVFIVTATNTGGSSATLNAQLFNGLQGAGQIFSGNINGAVAPGATVTANVEACGVVMDDYYFALSTSGNFTYKVRYYFSDANPNTEPNNTRATASVVDFDTLYATGQAINYQYRQNLYTDTVDYFKTYLPAGSFGNNTLEIKAKNNGCSGARWIQYALYRNTDAAPFATGYVGNTQTVFEYAEVFSSLPLTGVQQGDSLFIKIWSNAAFGYELKYGDGDVDFEDEYYDVDYEGYSYETISEAETKVAQVGYHVYENGQPLYDDDGNPVIDEADSYAFTLPQDGAITLYVKARNDGCGTGLYFDLLDEYGNSVSNFDYVQIASWNSTCNEIVYSIKTVRAFLAGTYRLRIHNGNSGTDERVSYTLKYTFQPYTGGSNDQESNNTQATALTMNEGETKKGYLKFISPTFDDTDHYKSTLSAEARLKVFVKARYRGNGEPPYSSNENKLYFSCSSTGFSRYIPLGSPFTTLTSDAVFYDTLTLAAVPQGIVRFLFYSSKAWEYEFHYEIVDTLSGPNDIEPNNTFALAQPVAASDTTYGRIRYTVNGTQDGDDYFRAVLPSDGKLKIIAQATNAGSSLTGGFEYITLSVYDGRKGSGLLLSKRLAGNDNIPLGQTVYDTITLCGVARDTVYFNITSFQKFQYRFRFELTDTVTNYGEPDNTAALALRTKGLQTHRSTLNYYYRGGTDGADFYKIPFGSNDVLKLSLQGTNRGCTDGGITIRVYNKTMNQLASKTFGGNSLLATGATIFDSLSVPITAPDTVYLRVDATGPFSYQFTTGPLLPSSPFTITGDSTVCLGQQTYKAAAITETGVAYHWSLPAGGGTITATDSIATVTWTQPGQRTVQLHLSNYAGNTPARQQSVVINSTAPTQVPVAYNFARSLSTGLVPAGATVQWYKNDVAIPGATALIYYAADAGTFTVKYSNDCGGGPASNAFTFPAAAQPQTIAFPHVANVTMSPAARTKLTATASSGLPVFYQKISGNATLVNDTLLITGAGIIIIKASQPGDDVYSVAADKWDTITVVKGPQTITFDSVPPKIYSDPSFALGAASSSGLGITYTVPTNNAYYHGGKLTLTGAGIVTVRASQDGDGNYNAATPVDRSFCVGVRSLSGITGDAAPCLATYRYLTQKIPGAGFVWTVSGGGTLTSHNDTAWVQWQGVGTHTLSVKAASGCDTVFSAPQTFTVTTSNNSPTAVSGMQPANFARDQRLPLTLSWLPGANTVSYDLYLWDSTATQPATPFAANLAVVSYTVPNNALAYNKTYKWKVVAKNPCTQTPGPVQQFRIIPLPDLVVSDVQAPLTANSGETITVSWKVTNIGPGKTFTDDSWSDGVYFSLDTVPNFRNDPSWDASSWSAITAQGRPLLLGKKVRPVALDSGAFYTNSLSFKLPNEFSFPVYVYVITDNGHPNYRILQASVANDTARKQQPMVISLSPTPDLRVETVFAPVSAFSGSTVSVSYGVKNYGVVTPAGIGWTDSLFISQNPLFDRNSCLPLMLPKINDSYYPNAVNAHSSNTLQLLPDSTRNKAVQVVIPNFIFGTWFIYVKTNAAKATALYEGSALQNNVNKAQMQIYLTPTPKLTVSTLSVPVSTASTTQPIGLNYNIKNEGFTDNIEKNKGHYLYRLIGSCPCYSNGGPGTVCVGPPKYFDSLALGSSYWVDRVYLSTDSTGLNTATATLVQEMKHGTQYSALQYADDMTGECGLRGKFNVEHALHPGAGFPRDTVLRIPSHLQPGNYYVYVHTNATKTVFEYPGTAQIGRSALPIAVSRPDAVVSAIHVPAASVGGQQVTISYAVTNNGPGAVFNHLRRDRLYISDFSSFDATATLLSTQTFTESLPVATAVPHTFTYNLPAATTGAKYFYVVTNPDSLFRETTATNNGSAAAATAVSAALPADLTVATIQLPDSVFTIFNNTIRYTVTNGGTGATAGTWNDSLFVSCNPVFNRATSFAVASRRQTRATAAGQAYTDTFSFAIPKMSYEVAACFPQTAAATAYFFLKTNADNSTYEGAGNNNNVSGSAAKIFVNPLVDHVVHSVSALSDTIIVGRPAGFGWTVKNIGYQPPYYYYNLYLDGIYFSIDSVPGANDVLAGSYLKYTVLKRGDSMNESRTLTTPNLPTGNYYVFAHTNYSDHIGAEKTLTNNTALLRNSQGAAKRIHVIQPLLPDVTDSILSAPLTVAVGQPITIIRRITNRGAGVTYPTTWYNDLRLSTDFFAGSNDGDRLLSQKIMNGGLAPGQYRDDTTTVTIPVYTVPGNYVIIGEADAYEKMAESNEANNLAFRSITVFTPPVTDLLVETVSHPDTVYLGYAIDTVKWVLKNASPNEAKGQLSEAVYLATGEVLDSIAVLLGIKARTIDLDPLKADSTNMTPLVTGVAEGRYNLFVKTDLLNNFIESDKANNATASKKPVYVKVKELPLNIAEPATLHGGSRYYKLLIPDSLMGSTILVTLKSPDSLLVRNEIYIGGGYVPTPARHDYKFEIPNYGNQQIVMTTVTQPVYYIEVRCATPNATLQNITLKAVKLPFAILSVQSASGGNTGNVTVKINGSLYAEGMKAQLQNGGGTITASKVYFTNSTQVFATFNLKGAPLGVYNLLLKKGDTATTVLSNGFAVVPTNNGGLITGSGPNTGGGNGTEPGCDPGAASGLNSQLVVELNIPPRVLLSRPLIIAINYRNPTNVDIPAQTRTLFSENVPMALTKEGVPAGTTSLYLEFTEAGGPPGVIRAGGSGTILIHSVAPKQMPASPVETFKLK